MAAKLSGSGGGNKYDLGQNSDINVTPFVDVMLVLLIIFMVAAPLATVSVEVTLPPAVAKSQVNPPRPVFISIQQGGRVYVGDNRSSLDALPDDVLKALGSRNPALERIYIRGDENVLYEDFMRVIAQLQDNGYYSVALVGEDVAGSQK